MKQNLLFLCFSLLISSLMMAQVTPGQVDNFEDGTAQGWSEGVFSPSPNPPINIATDGPAGAGDNYLQNDSAGGFGNGSKMAMFNMIQWAGNYSGQGIIAIKFDARVLTADLDLRVAMNGAGGPFSSTTSVIVTAGSGWTSVVIPISAADMVSVTANCCGTGTDIDATLAACTELRIISNSAASFEGETIVSRLEVDNIEASTTLGIEDFTESISFGISPNPSPYSLNIKLPSFLDNTKVEVFDILGKQIYLQGISQPNTAIDVSDWNSGVYLVKVSDFNSVQTKRFIKQ